MRVICENCNKEFKRKPSEIHNHIFCSKICWSLYTKTHPSKGKVLITCNWCNKNFYSWRKRNRKFCNKICLGKWHSKNLIREKASNWKGGMREYKCLICNKKVKVSRYRKSAKFCSRECKNKFDRKIIIVICAYCGKEIKKPPSFVYWNKQRNYKHIFCNKKCLSDFYSGENNPKWIKDRTKLKNISYSFKWSKEMKLWRKKVYERDKYTCRLCGNKSRKNNPVILNPHHIKRFNDCPDLREDINNGITLCEKCHKKTYGKEKIFEETFLNIIQNKDREVTDSKIKIEKLGDNQYKFIKV